MGKFQNSGLLSHRTGSLHCSQKNSSPFHAAEHDALHQLLLHEHEDFTALLLLPFVIPLARFCERLIPVRKKVKYTSLDPYLLENPPIALHQTVGRLRTLTRGAWHLLEKCSENVLAGKADSMKYEKFLKRTARIKRIQQEIATYLSLLAQRPLTAEQSEAIPVLTRCADDAGQLADYAGRILQETSHFSERSGKLSKKVEQESQDLLRDVGRLADFVLNALELGEQENVLDIRTLAKEVRLRAERLEEFSLSKLCKSANNVENSMFLLSLTGVMRQASDRLENIALISSALNHYE